jgi:hypothetical protein
MSSVIAEASADITSLIKRIQSANDYLDIVETKISFGSGDPLMEICKRHPMNVYQASKFLNEMKAIEDFIKARISAVESKLWKKYNENYARALSTRDIQAYLAGEPDVVVLVELQLEVNYVKRQLESVYEALKDLGWQLKYITELRIAELQDAVV